MAKTLGDLLREKFLQDTYLNSPLCATCVRATFCDLPLNDKGPSDKFHRCMSYNNGMKPCGTCLDQYCMSCRHGDQYAE